MTDAKQIKTAGGVMSSVDLFAAGRQFGKTHTIDQMINQLYRFTMPKWVALSARRRNDQKMWLKRITG